MKPSKDNPLIRNLQDSVSRIVDNLGFTSIDDTAHMKLVGIMAEMLRTMSHTCRLLAENAGRAPFSLTTTVDIKHLYRIHRIDLDGLTEYVRQVGPFPPREEDIHRYDSKSASAEKRSQRESPEDQTCAKYPTPPASKIPRFDDMDYEQLGFDRPECATPPPLNPTPPSVTATIPHIFSPDSNFDIPMYDPGIPPPPINCIPSSSFMTPEQTVREEQQATKLVQDWLFKGEQKQTSKPARHLKNEYLKAYPAEKTPSNTSLGAPKKTKKRQRDSIYEQRLREEQAIAEEKMKERKERKRQRADLLRRNAEKEAEMGVKTEKLPGLVFKFNSDVVREYRKLEQRNADGHAFDIDENDNKKMSTKLKKACSSLNSSMASTSTSSEDVSERKPLPKMSIRFRRVPRGILVKKIIKTKYRMKEGQWTRKDIEWKNNRGVLSQPEEPHAKRRTGSGTIPKLKLTKKEDGSYTII